MAIQAQLFSENSFGCPHDFLTECFENQRLEFEQLLDFQSERLRHAIHEQTKRHTVGFLRWYESRAGLLVAQKEVEIAAAARRTAELREFVRNLEIEGLTWQRIARENESAAAELSGTIRRLEGEDDAESCCPGRGEGRCRRCESRAARVVLLPCRHLCSCGECEIYLGTCPVCMAVKKGSIAIEAFV